VCSALHNGQLPTSLILEISTSAFKLHIDESRIKTVVDSMIGMVL
jgi:hypothetical protein